MKKIYSSEIKAYQKDYQLQNLLLIAQYYCSLIDLEVKL